VTGKVQKLLELHDMAPKKPTPYGSKQMYHKSEKEYDMTYFKGQIAGREGDPENWIRGRIQDELNIKKRKELLNAEALANLGEQAAAQADFEDVKTEEIESEEIDIFERKAKFTELSKRF
jgi:hypothetical protein